MTAQAKYQGVILAAGLLIVTITGLLLWGQIAIHKRRAAKKRQAAKQAAIAKQRQLARQAEATRQNEQELVANVELPGKKPATKTFNVAEADVAEYDYELDSYSTSYEPVQQLDCKRFIPSAGLTITVPCGN